ncbi:hypothetical protein ACTM6J_20300 [Citrobacter freundii]
METRCPKVYRRAGQRQHSWLGAKHDSPGSRREVAQVNQPVEKKYLKAPVFIVLVMVLATRSTPTPTPTPTPTQVSVFQKRQQEKQISELIHHRLHRRRNAPQALSPAVIPQG